MTEREARAWGRRHLAKQLRDELPPTGTPPEVDAIWDDECHGVAQLFDPDI